MASLRDAIKEQQEELQGGNAWVAFWKEERSWHSEAFHLDMGATLYPEDEWRLREIEAADPAAIVLNGYLSEDMTLDELTTSIRYHYEHRMNGITGFITEYSDRLSPEEIEEGRAAARAAGLPFSEKPFRDGEDFDPYVYDGSMSVEDYELMQRMTENERSERMDEPILSGYLSNLGAYAEGRPAGEWVTFPTTAEHMKEVFDRIGIDFKNYEEWHFTEFQSPIPGLAAKLGEHEHPDELNYLGKLLEMQFDDDREKFAAAIALGDHASSVEELINLAQNLDCYWIYPSVHNEEEYGHYLVDELEEPELPEEAKKYFMYEEYGRDAAINDGGLFTEQGYIYNNRNTFTRWYDGRDVPEEYRVTPALPEPERPDPKKVEMDAAPAGQTTAQPKEQAQEPRPVIPIVLTSEKPADKLKEITDRLEQGITELFESERYKEYLRVMSKFHNYSFNNTLLIAMQKPDASLVAGFSSWKNNFGRNVMKGEKGIKIIAPSPFTVKQEVEKTDPQTGKPVIGKDGKPVTEEKEIKVPAYKVVSVFDVSQTEGRELPDIAVDELTGDVDRFKDFFAALEQASPVPIGFEKIEGGAHGYYHLEEKRIAIDEGMSDLQTIKTAIHEIAHAKLHDIDLNAPKEEQKPRVDRRTREVEAESVAYTVCQHYGLDTSDYSFGYVAGWSSGKELAELRGSLETIRNTAAEMINAIDGHFAELQKAQEKEKAQPQHEGSTPEQPEAAPQEKAAFTPETIYRVRRNPYSDREENACLLQAYVTQENGRAKMGEVLFRGTPEKCRELLGQLNAGELTAGQVKELYAKPQEQPEMETVSPEKQAETPEAAPPKATHAPVHYSPINEAAARHAKEMNSFSDYKPGSATAAYRQQVDEAAELAERQKARVDPMYHEKIDSLLDTYARKLAANINKGYEIDARVPSILIAGGSNFPTGKKEKQNAARDRNMEEYQEIEGLLDKIRSTGMGGISADDPQAVQKLEKKLAGLEKTQETMKAVNAYYRKHKTLDGCPHISPEHGQKLIASMASYDRAPYPTWALSNNNAEIRRVKERIKSLTQQKEIGFTGWEFDGGRVEANTQDNRLQIFFDEKPDAAVREELKSNGFRWSPKAEAWQRQLNSNAYFAANYVKSIQPLTGEKPTDLQRAHIRAQQSAAQTKDAPREKAAMPEYIYKIEANPRSDSRENLSFLQAYLPHGDGTAAIGDVLYIGTPEKCRELLGQLNAGELTQGEVKELYAKAQEQPETGQDDTFSIYQLKDGDETRDYRFEPYDRLQAAGLTVDRANYELVYTAPLVPGTSLDDIFTRFNIDHPKDFKGHSLSVSDVVVLHQDGQDTAHYVDRGDFKQVPEFLQEKQPQLTPDELETGEKIRTPRGTLYVTGMSREQMEAVGYGVHHQSDDGKYLIMGNGTRAFAVATEQENPLKAAEQTTEQNYNMIDGWINNTPTVDELEAKVKAGETISLVDLANAVKADKERGKAAKPEKKPSIRAQLKADKERAAQKKPAKQKSQDLERS